MRAMWRLERASVEEVRAALPARRRSAYTTVQTVLNRLAERGLLRRNRAGHMILYSPRVSEADYLRGSLDRTLADASEGARRTALASLVGDLDPSELEEIRDLTGSIRRRRRRGT